MIARSILTHFHFFLYLTTIILASIEEENDVYKSRKYSEWNLMMRYVFVRFCQNASPRSYLTFPNWPIPYIDSALINASSHTSLAEYLSFLNFTGFPPKTANIRLTGQNISADMHHGIFQIFLCQKFIAINLKIVLSDLNFI